MELILASSSPARQQLLDRLMIPYFTHSPNIDETPRPAEHPQKLAYRLATAKALALQHLYPNHLIIGSDQVATLNGIDPIGKPYNRTQAFTQLKAASGNCLTFFTAVSLLNTQTGLQDTLVDSCKVHFRPLSDHQIGRYLDLEDVLGCAGSFKSEGLGAALFRQIDGGDPTSLMGLPLIKLCDLLAKQHVYLLN